MARSILSILLFILFLGLFAQLSYDISVGESVVPISGQTFALLLAAWFLQPWQTAIAVILYLLFGGLGIPLFADGASGWKHLVGYTAGYLWMFVVAAVFISWCSQRMKNRTFLKIAGLMFLATAAILFVGAGFLTWKLLDPAMFHEGSVPFIPGGIIKSALAAGIIVFVERMKTG